MQNQTTISLYQLHHLTLVQHIPDHLQAAQIIIQAQHLDPLRAEKHTHVLHQEPTTPAPHTPVHQPVLTSPEVPIHDPPQPLVTPAIPIHVLLLVQPTPKVPIPDHHPVQGIQEIHTQDPPLTQITAEPTPDHHQAQETLAILIQDHQMRVTVPEVPIPARHQAEIVRVGHIQVHHQAEVALPEAAATLPEVAREEATAVQQAVVLQAEEEAAQAIIRLQDDNYY